MRRSLYTTGQLVFILFESVCLREGLPRKRYMKAPGRSRLVTLILTILVVIS